MTEANWRFGQRIGAPRAPRGPRGRNDEKSDEMGLGRAPHHGRRSPRGRSPKWGNVGGWLMCERAVQKRVEWSSVSGHALPSGKKHGVQKHACNVNDQLWTEMIGFWGAGRFIVALMVRAQDSLCR